jgi:hypothetical protein
LKLALLIQSSPLNIAAGFNNILIGRMHHWLFKTLFVDIFTRWLSDVTTEFAICIRSIQLATYRWILFLKKLRCLYVTLHIILAIPISWGSPMSYNTLTEVTLLYISSIWPAHNSNLPVHKGTLGGNKECI